MTKSAFDEFVRRQQREQQAEAAFDPQQRLEQWLSDLNDLYNQITAYLQTYVDRGTAQIEYRDKTLNEDFIGFYPAREMILRIGRATIIFTPIGTMLVSAKGRVDVQGPAGAARFVLVNKLATTALSLVSLNLKMSSDPSPTPQMPMPEAVTEFEWAWKIASPPPEIKFVELTQEAFFEIVLEVANA